MTTVWETPASGMEKMSGKMDSNLNVDCSQQIRRRLRLGRAAMKKNRKDSMN